MISVTQEINTFMPISVAFKREYRRLAKKFLEEYGAGLCHDLAAQSVPLKSMGGNASASWAKHMVDHKKVTNIAFKPIQSRTFGQYLLNNDVESMEAYGFKSTSPLINQLIATKQWARLLLAFNKFGGITPDGLGRQTVYDRADLALLYKWTLDRGNGKGGRKKGKRGEPFYIRQKATIQQVLNAPPSQKVGFMVGGWLMAANMIGNRPDPATRRVQQAVWMQGKGKGYAKFEETDDYIALKIVNAYANIGNYMNNTFVQGAINRRWKLMEKAFPVIFWEAAKNVGWEPTMF